MSLFHKRHIHLSDYPEHVDRVRTVIEDKGYFSVSLAHSSWGLRLSKRKRHRIYSTVLDRLLPLMTECSVYDLNAGSSRVKPLEKTLTKDRSRYRLAFHGGSWSPFDQLLYMPPLRGSIVDIRGGIVCRCKLDLERLGPLFEHCYNPNAIDNPGIACGKKELRAARDSGKRGIFHAIIEKTNHGLQSITFLAAKGDILKLFNLAADTCAVTRNQRRFHLEPLEGFLAQEG